MPPKRKRKDTSTRARSSRTLRPSPVTDLDASDSLPARSTKRVRRVTSRTGTQEVLDGGIGEYGLGSSKPATIEQHLMDQNKKSKEFVQGFKEQVAQSRERLQDVLGKLKNELTNPADTNDNDDNLAQVYAALQAATLTLSTKDNPLFEQTQRLLRVSHAILNCHRKVSRESRAPNLSSPRETWTQDEEGMRKLLEYGRLFGEKVVEGWITPSMEDGEEDKGSSDDGEEGMSEAENLARGLFEWRRNGCGLKGQESWGAAARRQMVALAGVVRTLPPKGE